MKNPGLILVLGGAIVAAAACSSGSSSGGGGNGISSGEYNVTGSYSPNPCNLTNPFYATLSSSNVTSPGARGANSVDVLEGTTTYTYDINGSNLTDVPDGIPLSTTSCNQPAVGGGYQCGTANPYNCQMTFALSFTGTISTPGSAFKLTDNYMNGNGATACSAAVVTSALGAGVTLPCTSVDNGNFVHR